MRIYIFYIMLGRCGNIVLLHLIPTKTIIPIYTPQKQITFKLIQFYSTFYNLQPKNHIKYTHERQTNNRIMG